ncbi:hypothetical protein AX15_001668 [Amanita polypyramis BW_CC]|nr:hypothetical protein AX15_001668 [Amanita polypyramis BW_CC]
MPSSTTSEVDTVQKAPGRWQDVAGFEDDKSLLRNLPYEILSHIFILCCCRGCDHSSVWLPYHRDGLPYQLIISHVCSKWRQVALVTRELWSNVDMTLFGPNYDHISFIYQTWVSRAGSYPINVTLDLAHLTNPTLELSTSDVHKVLQDTVMPYRVKRLDIALSHKQLFALSDLDLDIEELTVALSDFPGDGDIIVPFFFSRIRSVYFQHIQYDTSWEEFDIPSKALYLPWHQLRVLECPVCRIPLSPWLNVLRQTPSLEECRLYVCGTGRGRLEAVTMPNLRSLVIDLRQVHPDIVIPLISASKVTTLGIFSPDGWSVDTYDIMKKQYKLGQLQRIGLRPTNGFPLRVAGVLDDAPMIYDLFLGSKSILDDETREKIASGQLGHFLTDLALNSCGDSAEEWLDMVEARQKNVRAALHSVTNWREMFTGLRRVKFSNVETGRAYEERVAALKLLGVEVTL